MQGSFIALRKDTSLKLQSLKTCHKTVLLLLHNRL